VCECCEERERERGKKMKFGKLLSTSELPQYRGRYLNYKLLKDELKKLESGTSSSSAQFFQLLNVEKERLDQFVGGELAGWKKWLEQLWASLEKQKQSLNEEHETNKGASSTSTGGVVSPTANKLKEGLQAIQLESLELQRSVILMEQFINMNYTAFSKILKKHDKLSKQKTKEGYLKNLEADSFYSYFDAQYFLSSLKTLSDTVFGLLQQDTPLGSTAPSGGDPTPLSPAPVEEPSLPPKPKTNSSSVWVFLFGTFLGQVANNVGQVTMPLVLFFFTNSPATVSLVLTLTSLTNGVGSLLGGWVFGAVSQKRWLLVFTNVGRGVTLGFAAMLFATGSLSLGMAIALFCFDYAILGVIDTVRNAAPAAFVGRDRKALEAFNSNYQIAFDLGTTVGPLLAGLVIRVWSFSQAMWIAPVTFVAVGLNSILIDPSVKEEEEKQEKDGDNGSGANSNTPLAALRQLFANPVLALVFSLTLTLQLYRIKSLYSSTFAEVFTSGVDEKVADENTAWLMATFGVGGLAGALLFKSSFFKGSSETTISIWGFSGLLVFAGM